MSRWHGPQHRGAARVQRAEKRREAEARNARSDPLRRARCPRSGKVKFTADQARAEIVGAVIKHSNGNGRRRERRTYLCPGCGWHHLTSQPKAVTR